MSEPKPIIYVAHPVSGDVRGNVQKVLDWLRWLTETDPSRIYIAPWVGEVQAHYDMDPIPEDFYARVLADDCEVVSRLDGILLVGGKVSRGMELELNTARQGGKAVFNMVSFAFVFDAEVDFAGYVNGHRSRRNCQPLEDLGAAYMDCYLEH